MAAMDPDDPDMQLSVPLQPLYDELVCPICFGIIKDCMITPCGHVFCRPCIEECLNRKHVCPVCNGPVDPRATFKNHHIDRLIAIVDQQKEKASAAHFERIVTLKHSAELQLPAVSSNGTPIPPSSSASPLPSSAAGGGHRKLTPLEELFRKHMKRCIAAYDDHYGDLVRRKEAMVARVRSDFASKVAATHSAMQAQQQQQQRGDAGTAPAAGKAERAMAELNAQCDTEIARVEAEFDATIALLLEGYDKLLAETVPSPAFLPVSVTLSIPTKSLRFPKVTLKAVDHMVDIKRRFTEAVEKTGDPIVSFGADVKFLVYRPLELGHAPPAAAPTAAAVTVEPFVVIDDPAKALHQYGVQTGSELAMVGTFQLRSDLPKECFSMSFSKDKPDVFMDYFTCKDCRTNWICKPCAEQCHKGHQVIPYILHHRPTWACCYCAKNKLCKIVPARK